MKLLTTLLLFLYCSLASAQKLTVQGYVQDAASGEKLVGASIYLPSSKKGITTNNYGYFSITIPSDTAGIVFSVVGYEPQYKFFEVGKVETVNIIELNKLTKQQSEVIVYGKRRIPIEQRTNMGQINVPIEIVKALPKFLGEADILKAIQALPGVSQGAEGTSGILVRGGGPDQNLILLDGSPLYNTQHLFGIFSTFNADAIKNVEFYKGGFPARFGGRLSSVIDVVSKDGNMKKYHGVVGAGIIMSRATLEGPIVKDKTSFILSGRRSYLDVIAQPFIKKAAKEEGIDVNVAAYLYDINAKINHIVSKKDRLFLSVFSSQDFLKFRTKENTNQGFSEQKLKIGYGNVVSTFRWNHIFNKKLFSNTIVGFTKYRFVTQINNIEKSTSDTTNIFAKYFSSIADLSASFNFDYKPNAKNSIKFGAYLTNHDFKPGATSIKVTDANQSVVDTVINPTSQKSLEGAIYFEDDVDVTDKLKVNIGVHTNFFKSATKLYPSVQPRVSARYLLPQSWAVKFGYSQMAQPLHLLTNSTTTLPTDLWVPSTDKIKPMKSEQFAVGVAKTLWNGKFEFSAETYYKTMDGVIEYKDGASYLNATSAAWDSKVEQGKGWSRGIELLLQKIEGKTKGWIGYTLSKTDRQFANINFGKKFAYKYDRRHDFEMVVTHTINKNWEISGSWGFSTAIANSLPVANYPSTGLSSPYERIFNQSSVSYYNGRNGFRLLNYHRLDFSVNWKKQKKKYSRTWNLSVYNVYNRKNPFYYFIDFDNISNQGSVKSITLLPVIPNISWIIEF
jgi:CarboxypepD_reg-like domain/TonB-dependent Receptor Plug Domain